MSRAGTAVGSIVALGLATGLPLALGALPPPTDLGADLLAPRPYVILEHSRAPAPPIILDASSRERAATRSWPDTAGAGLNLHTWQVEYGHRWEREVTVPFLVGPFAREDMDVCGWSIHVSAGLFDTTGAGAGLKAAIHQAISSYFPHPIQDEETGISVIFPEVRETEVRILFETGHARVLVGVELVDGTLLAAAVPVRLISRSGAPVVERDGSVRSTWRGPTREKMQHDAENLGATEGGGFFGLLGCVFGPLGCVVGAGLGAGVGSDMGRDKGNRVAEERLKEEVTTRIDQALEQLALGLKDLEKPWSPFPRRPSDTIRLRLASDPLVSVGGITLPLCASVHVAMPKLDAAVPGWPRLVAARPLERSRPNVPGAFIELTADVDAINEAMYFLWQSGELRELGQESVVLDALPERLRDLAFEVKGFDPGLPPSARSRASKQGIPIVLGDVALGTWENRRVVGHAVANIGIQPSGDTLELQAHFGQVSVNCVESGEHTRLTPCLSDLLPVVRDLLAERPLVHRFSGGDVLARLPMLTFQGLRLELSNLRARTAPGPSSLRINVDARIR
jgi:hypothetical protein